MGFTSLCKLDDDILYIGGKNSKGFYLIKISNHQLIKNIIGPQEIYSIYKCYDGLILCSIKNEKGNCALIKYKYENENMNKIIVIKENELISVSRDKTMKIWKLNNENKFECNKTITFQNSESDCNILNPQLFSILLIVEIFE